MYLLVILFLSKGFNCEKQDRIGYLVKKLYIRVVSRVTGHNKPCDPRKLMIIRETLNLGDDIV